MFNPHQRRGYSDSPFVRIHDFYTAGSRKGLDGVDNGGHQVTTDAKRECLRRKTHILVIEKYVRESNRIKKVPDLVELIMKPTDPVKDELQRKTMNMHQLKPEITHIRF